MLIVVDDFCEVSSTKSVGDPGFVVIIAPFPFRDTIESPYLLIAMILAKISDPQGRLKGEP